ncbi:unnamed protein product [Cuscuta epithymum]|nr:unnamed protein product [Cuscuta epithymum]
MDRCRAFKCGGDENGGLRRSRGSSGTICAPRFPDLDGGTRICTARLACSGTATLPGRSSGSVTLLVRWWVSLAGVLWKEAALDSGRQSNGWAAAWLDVGDCG